MGRWRTSAALALAYFAAARMGLGLGAVGGVATTVWPPSGLSLAALLLMGTGVWPGVAAGALAANLSAGAPWAAALGIAAGNTLEALAGALLLRRAGFLPALERTRDVAALVVLAAAVPPLVSATVGTACAFLAGMVPAGRAWTAWRAWWLGDCLGVAVAAPLLLTWSGGRPLPRGRRAEGALLLASLGALSAALFFGLPMARLLQPYCLFPLLAWAALRFGPRGAATASALASVIAVAGTSLGRGSFAMPDLVDSLMGLQAFMGVAAVTALTLAAARAERNAAEERTRGLNEELERRVAERTEALEAAKRESEAFSYSIAHDLRAPLRSVQGFSDVLRRRWTGPPEDLQHFQRIEGAVQRMYALIEGVLRLSGLSHAPMRLQRVDLTALARQAAADLARAEPDRRVDVRVQDGLEADADPALAGVLLSNLVENAWKFTRGREDARIEVARERAGGGEAFVVRDNGAGFDMAHAGRLFQAFQRLHTRAEFPGSGIGLAMVRRVAERHGGRVWAEAERGKGAAVYFTLG